MKIPVLAARTFQNGEQVCSAPISYKWNGDETSVSERNYQETS